MIDSKQIQRPQLVLVVDDQEIHRDVLESILEDEYDVIMAENGKEALELMYKYQDELSIVLLDLMMPVMSGLQVLEHVHNDEQLKQIPIIVLTADSQSELPALQLGAADFVTKPFEVHEVIRARVNRIIELSEGRQLISSAERDRLTMLYSRNFFFEYANRIFQYHPEMHMDAIVLNIEQFHMINALNGREFGDDVLRVIGNEIRGFLAETNGIASRLEGDRFDIYCVGQPDYMALLNRFQEKVNRISEKVRIHLRMGVKPWREGVEPVLLFDQARSACNMVRGDYQNPLKIYNEDMHEQELFHQRLLNELRPAIENKQFVVYYQPKYYIQDEVPSLSSAEALVRWKHPELGLIPPSVFVPLFEGNGLISTVDNFVWTQAAEQIAAWKKKYGVKLPVSINVSRADMFDPNLVEHLQDLIRENGLDYKDLKLEVTESSYTDNAKKIIEVIKELKETGFDIEMDDFGSGYSSLNMLSDMPIDVLKMDMKFVRNIEHSVTDQRLVSLILDIAKYLEVRVVAEGVETEGQLEFLKKGGCDLVQGYYFSRPLAPEEFEVLLKKEFGLNK